MPGVYPRGREGGRGQSGFSTDLRALVRGGAARTTAAGGGGADGGVATGHLYPESWWPPSRTWPYGEPDTKSRCGPVAHTNLLNALGASNVVYLKLQKEPRRLIAVGDR